MTRVPQKSVFRSWGGEKSTPWAAALELKGHQRAEAMGPIGRAKKETRTVVMGKVMVMVRVYVCRPGLRIEVLPPAGVAVVAK